MNRKYISLYIVILATLLISCGMDKKQLRYEGEDLTGQVSLSRDKKSKQAELTVNLPGDWQLYGTDTNREVDRDKAVISGMRPGKYPLAYTDVTYQVYQFTSPQGEAVIAERQLPIEGSYNFRELGGFRTKDGKYTRWGMVFRSDDLMHLTGSDIHYLNSIPLRTIVDFRSESKIQASPDKIPSGDTRYVPLSITPGNLTLSSGFDLAGLTEQAADSMMRAVNRQLATDEASIQQYKTFFALLQNRESLPLVFHCTAGKDRTGFGAYLFLSSLGVDQEVIMKDYLASNHYLAGKYSDLIRQYPFVKPLMEVRQAYLQNAIDSINESYGSVDTYLENVLDVDLKRMKEIYLY
ncbi:MAG: tyrosine-protein phosphatase [Tannerellaceae bacterium]|nr:tyrosine-protein phosphatase [Tannerellaceae bacterium]